jgi:hypothetical protein
LSKAGGEWSCRNNRDQQETTNHFRVPGIFRVKGRYISQCPRGRW